MQAGVHVPPEGTYLFSHSTYDLTCSSRWMAFLTGMSAD